MKRDEGLDRRERAARVERAQRLDVSFEIVPKNVSYENKPNKSPVSDVRVIGNEIGCRQIELFLVVPPLLSSSIPSRSTVHPSFLLSTSSLSFLLYFFFPFVPFSSFFFSSLHFNGMFRVLPSFLVFFFLIVAVVVCTFLRYTRERSCRSHSRCTRVSFSTGCRRESQVRTFPGKKYPIFPCRSKRAAKRGEE